ncbi:cold-shock protein [Microbulbifer epialgicus]|uniref:Cold-shock protein n=1 Tax=Microbulbifer epialgicus TaxID=393907 RepID=A0ABV4NUC9_9GAMM
MQAVVKMWIRSKGYGFLENGNGPDVFVRKAELQNCHYLKPGAVVNFECHASDRGLVAKNVTIEKFPSQGFSEYGKPAHIGVMT